MHILADSNMTGLDDTFARHGDIRRFEGRNLQAKDLGDAEVLLVRSVTQVNADLLIASKVRFVGTATIGTDHLDTRWLDQQSIAWASAPGCNADAAAQYTLGMMFLAASRLGWRMADKQVSIAGHGNVGSRLHRLLDTLGVGVTCYDPPLAETGALQSTTLSEALQADIFSLHVPLQAHGAHPTVHMMNRETLGQMRPGALLVNAARGEVVEQAPLISALQNGRLHAALDVWPGEPDINHSVLLATTVATPHVAGYSVEGKARGTRMVFEAFLAWLDSPDNPGTDSPRIVPLDIDWSSIEGSGTDEVVAEAVMQATRVRDDDARMRSTMPGSAASFDLLRRAHAPRHEFGQLSLSPPHSEAATSLGKLGFVIRR